ncbi:MAG TPA: NYN domain-containing protein [Isosphaeraceae bacterium]|jgi:uncharacterized LabA/DUF88 family protein|nr:NYN domain-containing protein [Isosphaeraceae bacterium]
MAADTVPRADRLAILIDAENASARMIEPLLREVAKYGTASVKRIYGDWTGSHLVRWKEMLHQFAIQPIQQFRYTTGKNSSDSALIIDAMDLLYTQKFDGFCLVSSDSDFTRLASRIREAGLVVYGFGEKKTPEPFVKACDKFIFTEILAVHEPKPLPTPVPSSPAKTEEPAAEAAAPQPVAAVNVAHDQPLHTLLTEAYNSVADEDGWANLAVVGNQLTKLSPSFDPRNYGVKKLADLIAKTGLFEIKKVASKKNKQVHSIQIKLKANN